MKEITAQAIHAYRAGKYEDGELVIPDLYTEGAGHASRAKATGTDKTPVVYYRRSSSEGVFVDQRDLLMTNPDDLEAWILAIYGSPNERQIDGLGGANPLTSKFAIIGPPTRPGADVDYTFYQV